jgi:hypothetical protein
MDTKPEPIALGPLCRQPAENPRRFGSGPCPAPFHGDGKVEGNRHSRDLMSGRESKRSERGTAKTYGDAASS